jgi:transcriptional regulator with XRE-family HTH domain
MSEIMTLSVEIGRKLRKVRELKSYSQEYVAHELDISPRHYSRLESGQLDMKLAFIEQTCKLLEIEPIQLFGFDERYFFEQCSNGVGKNITVNNIPDNVLSLIINRLNDLEEKVNSQGS